MSELDRIKSLAGLATNNVAEESVEREMKEQTTNESSFGPTMYQVRDENGQEYDIVKYRGEIVAMPSDPENLMGGGDGPYDYDEENCEIYGIGKCTKINEASGDFAEPFYELQDEFCGGECTSPAHKALIDELVMYMSGDDIKGFVADFRRHHDMNDVEESVEEAELSEEEQKILEAIPYMFKLNKEGKSVEEIAKELNMTVDAVKDAMSKAKNEDVEEGRYDGPNSSCCDAPLKNYNDGLGICSDCGDHAGPHEDELEEGADETLEESPTMDTTQLAIIMKNAGLSEETIAQKLEEWANTPEGVGEVEPTEHGDAYDMAQAVNTSLKKYLDAKDMKVQVSEDTTSEDLTALYEAYKANKK